MRKGENGSAVYNRTERRNDVRAYFKTVGSGRRHATVDLVVLRRPAADDVVIHATTAAGLDGAGRLGRSHERRHLGGRRVTEMARVDR